MGDEPGWKAVENFRCGQIGLSSPDYPLPPHRRVTASRHLRQIRRTAETVAGIDLSTDLALPSNNRFHHLLRNLFLAFYFCRKPLGNYRLVGN
jgi:hypothetical protein